MRSLFRMEFDEMVSTWARVQYDWLPAHDAVPKAVGARLSRHQLQSLDVSALFAMWIKQSNRICFCFLL